MADTRSYRVTALPPGQFAGAISDGDISPGRAFYATVDVSIPASSAGKNSNHGPEYYRDCGKLPYGTPITASWAFGKLVFSIGDVVSSPISAFCTYVWAEIDGSNWFSSIDWSIDRFDGCAPAERTPDGYYNMLLSSGWFGIEGVDPITKTSLDSCVFHGNGRALLNEKAMLFFRLDHAQPGQYEDIVSGLFSADGLYEESRLYFQDAVPLREGSKTHYAYSWDDFVEIPESEIYALFKTTKAAHKASIPDDTLMGQIIDNTGIKIHKLFV